MKRLLILLYSGLLALLATATLVEQVEGTDFVEQVIYHSFWFCSWWGAIALLLVAAFMKRRLWHRLPVVLLHASFLVILIGGLITFLCGQKGLVHLKPGTKVGSFVASSNGQRDTLPFTLQLDSFKIEYYAGTDAPSNYRSFIRIGYLSPDHDESVVSVSMNNVLSCEGYRFYQSSFDPEGKGSWLSVNYDPWGIPITYGGYLLLGLSMLLLLVSKKESFYRLLRHPMLRKGGTFIVLLCITPCVTEASRQSLPVLSRHQADSLASRQVIYQDRVVPFNTLARDFLLKISGKTSYRGLTAEQVIGGWLLRPDVWQNEPMIVIKSDELRRRLNLSSTSARLVDLFDGQTYKLQAYWAAETANVSGKQSVLEKALVETDEKVGLILMLQKGTLIRPLPSDGSVKPLSESKVQAELLYNRIPFSKWLFIFNLSIGVFSFLHLLYRYMKSKKSEPSSPLTPSRSWSRLFFILALLAATLFHLLGYGLRWYIGGRIPLSNGYETMQFLALCTLFLSGIFCRRFPFIFPFGFLLSGFTLLVSYLGQMNPQISPLMPVLVSPWLSAHVSFIMMSYALFAFMMLNGILALFVRHRARMLMLLSRLLLFPATFFLGAGIFMGAVWANVSWGRYWAWDPKEVWALISFMVYGVAFHSHSLSWLRKPLCFHLYMIGAFLTILMTYFGVNYLLGGMHSYANS